MTDRLQFVCSEEWSEIVAELERAGPRGESPDLDAMQCAVLVDAVNFYRAAGAADVAALMELASTLEYTAYDDGSNGKGDTPECDAARAALESALRVALAPKAEPQPNTTGGAFFKQCTAFTAPAAQPGAQESAK